MLEDGSVFVGLCASADFLPLTVRFGQVFVLPCWKSAVIPSVFSASTSPL